MVLLFKQKKTYLAIGKREKIGVQDVTVIDIIYRNGKN